MRIDHSPAHGRARRPPRHSGSRLRSRRPAVRHGPRSVRRAVRRRAEDEGTTVRTILLRILKEAGLAEVDDAEIVDRRTTPGRASPGVRTRPFGAPLDPPQPRSRTQSSEAGTTCPSGSPSACPRCRCAGTSSPSFWYAPAHAGPRRDAGGVARDGAGSVEQGLRATAKALALAIDREAAANPRGARWAGRVRCAGRRRPARVLRSRRSRAPPAPELAQRDPVRRGRPATPPHRPAVRAAAAGRREPRLHPTGTGSPAARRLRPDRRASDRQARHRPCRARAARWRTALHARRRDPPRGVEHLLAEFSAEPGTVLAATDSAGRLVALQR